MAETVRVAAMSDLHYGRTGTAPLLPLLGRAAEQADVLALCGDLTDHGLPDEARALAKELSGLQIPMVAVLGNHDYEADRVDELKAIFAESRVRILDGDAVELRGVSFAGIKGFCGGFGRRALGPWGEATIKAFVREALDEALKLETALSKLKREPRVAILHYSPVAGTVDGEPLEIYPFLGSSRLEEPLLRYPVDVVIHGHAHNGCPEAKTISGTPVYNVSMSLLQQRFPDEPAFRLIELTLPDASEAAPTGAASSTAAQGGG
ncbi:MAG: metallophosphoesterase [Gemmatimonadota bacterium]|nr:metallophosphoesterase [Gemmatimonadota bacterium]